MSQRLVPRLHAGSGATGRSVRDTTSEALRRLRMLCVFLTLAPPMKLVITWLVLPSEEAAGELLPMAATFAATTVCSAITYSLIRRESISPERRLDIGFGYQALLALAAALFRHQQPWAPGDGLRDFSIVAVVILVFAAFVPNPPKRTLLAGLAAAAMDPLGLLLARALFQVPLPPLGQTLALTLPTFGAAVLATMISRVIYGLARSVDEARQLGSYRLCERLGEGGMGEVWRAEHQLLARPAAVKLVRADAAVDTAALARFQREAQATACLTSPHTIQLYDFGIAEDGTFYYVMELLDGLDLEQLVQRHGPMPAERVAHLLRQMCESLAEAHHRGLVHRDIKPANVYVCRYGRQVDFVKVLDFGLVKATEPLTGGGDEPAVTMKGTIAGTPAFAAPEIVLGEPIDGRTDIYALGCVAYWLLTGFYVFEARTPMKMMMAHVHEQPKPPSERTELAVPEALERIILDCLEKERERRPRSADEVAERLEALTFEQPWARDRAGRWWQMHMQQDAA